MDVVLSEVCVFESITSTSVLIQYSDSCLCSKSNQSVDDWIGFDWVGGLTSWVDDKGNGHGVSDYKLPKIPQTDLTRAMED